MKKIVSLFAVLVMLISMAATPAMADVTFYWGNNGNQKTFPAQYGTTDNSGTATVFFVHSDGNANIKLKQSKGSANEITYSIQILEPLFTDGAEEWGKFEIKTCHAESGKIQTYQWDDTYFNSSITLKFDKVGDYYVYIRPYTQAEMRESTNKTKMFGAWNKYPKWWIESKKNCTVSTSSPFSKPSSSSSSNSSQTQLQYAEVQIIHQLSNGNILNKTRIQSTIGYHDFTPYWSDSSYELTSSYTVRYEVTKGTNIVYFTYKEKNNSSSSTNNNSSNNNSSNSNSTNVGSSSSVHNIGIPNLNGRTYNEGDMNIAVLWVQQQMKQTRKYYQGEQWDVTGNLGDHTMKEIAKFMQDNGYRNHDGHVDQTVINTFASYLGNGVAPVYVGGFFDKMDTIMTGGSAGSMKRIDKNSSSTSIKWVQCCLSKLGFYHGSINGRFDSATISAVHAFQEYAGFEKRDYVTLGVARDMILFCNNRGCDLSDLP